MRNLTIALLIGCALSGFLCGRWYGSRKGGGFDREATCTLAELPHASVIVCEPPPNMERGP